MTDWATKKDDLAPSNDGDNNSPTALNGLDLIAI